MRGLVRRFQAEVQRGAQQLCGRGDRSARGGGEPLGVLLCGGIQGGGDGGMRPKHCQCAQHSRDEVQVQCRVRPFRRV